MATRHEEGRDRTGILAECVDEIDEWHVAYGERVNDRTVLGGLPITIAKNRPEEGRQFDAVSTRLDTSCNTKFVLWHAG